jgi:phosphoribosylformylglycinamidine synthase
MIGLLEDKDKKMTLDFKEKGDLIYLVGNYSDDMGSSEYLSAIQGVKLSPVPSFDLDEEFKMQQTIQELITQNLINAAHDVSDGGLFVTLVEMGFPRGLGFDIETDMDIRTDAFLFGEGQGRVVVTLPEDKRDAFSEYKKSCDTNIILLGHVTKGKMQIDLQAFGFIDEARDIYMNALGAKIES